MVPDHQVRRKWSGDASKKVQLFKVGGSRIIGTAVIGKPERQLFLDLKGRSFTRSLGTA